MARGDRPIDHLLRRAAFGARASELSAYSGQSLSTVIETLLDVERQADDIDARIGDPAYAGVTPRSGQFSPYTNIDDARQRWLFRMVHSPRPLEEKMALFWHNHFATAYGKVAGAVGALQATKMMALKAGELPGPRGQIELFRQHALGKFRDLLVEVAKDPAMLVWLDGRSNTRTRPQENFGREIMEVFTVGVGHYAESDVYAAARVFTGWNLQRGAGFDSNNDPHSFYQFVFNANQHDTGDKAFTFPVQRNGGRTIPARAAGDGMQDGLDLIDALATHPETARRLAGRLWNFFISEQEAPDPAFVADIASLYLRSDTALKPVVRQILRSRWFLDPDRYFTRYSWPVEFVARAIREVGWEGFSLDAARTPLVNMGQTLFEPPDVNGWETGRGWYSTGAMLARMNFAATLASNQRANIAGGIGASAQASPERLVEFLLERYSAAPYDADPRAALAAYAAASVPAWPASAAQLATKAAGVTRLIVASAEYQLV
jgi:uncharacterized protein (DUF1800 family)